MREERILLIDDLDPQSEAAETVTFGLDGKQYEIDLSDRNAAALRTTFAKYADAGRRIRTRGAWRRPARTGPSAPAAAWSAHRQRMREIRAWAHTQGLPLADRGRIPDEIIAQYAAAQNAPAAVRPAPAPAPAVKSAASPPPPAPDPAPATPQPNSREIRAWARRQGIAVPARGHVPQSLAVRFAQAHTG